MKITESEYSPLAEETKVNVQKELWRVEMLTRLSKVNNPKLAFSPLTLAGKRGARMEWFPPDHSNHFFWFTLENGKTPQISLYLDPTSSGSTQGLLIHKNIPDDKAFAKLPFTIEQWVDSEAKKEEPDGGFHPAREALRKGIPEDLEQAWRAVRAQLVTAAHYEMHHPSSIDGIGEAVTEDQALLGRLQ
jgi:hypothetical protein